MKKWNGPFSWFLAGAGTGLVIAFSTRWYWGAVTFVLLSLVIALTSFAGQGRHELGPRKRRSV